MDRKQAWRVTSRYAKTAAEWTAEKGRWTAENWREEADRRKGLRRELKPLVTDAKRAVAVARRLDPEKKQAATHRAERELREAQRAVPDTLLWLATKVTAGLAVLAWWGLPKVPADVWRWTAVAAVAAAVGGVGWLAYQIARYVEPEPGLEPTAEEAQLLARLQPEHWREHCEGRGLAGTLTGRPELTLSGVVADVRLEGTWTAGKLRQAEEHVRALLGCRTALRMEIRAGDRGGWARLILRTRSAADGIVLTGWKPGDPWGIDTVTGDLVHVPLGRRMLIAGTSGAGKSWSTRPVLAEASETAENRLVVIDPKRVEAINWQHRARTAITPDEVLDVSDELVEEMHERLALVPRGRDTIEISPERPRLTVFVDEGAEVIAMSKGNYARTMENFRTIARMARAAEIILLWATQKPTMDKNGGIDPQISAQITYRAALALSTSGEARVVFGEDATEKGWHAHDLEMPGFAMLRHGPKAKPHPIKTRAFSPADVIALPDRPVWSRYEEPAAPARPALTLVKSGPVEDDDDSVYVGPTPVAVPPVPAEPPTIPATFVTGPVRPVPAPIPAPAAPADKAPAVDAPPPDSADGKVLAALVAAGGPVQQKAVVETTGLPKGTVSKAVKRLTDAGFAVRTDEGIAAAKTAGEVSA
ncbi:MarR family transcriptional regulator [Kitasatospora sp. NPDC001309]|uniref:helix-turn-helix transcriptional regulator n=1 Tax=Kitasatospora sp. NPDC001309 TaxID=3364013 RepID=UPI0036D19FC1